MAKHTAELPEWKKTNPYPTTSWGHGNWDTQNPYPTTDFTMPLNPPERLQW